MSGVLHRALHAMALAVAAGALLAAGAAWAEGAPPDTATAQSSAYRSQAYPDWDGRVLAQADLAEHRRVEGGVIGVLALRGTQPAWVSVLYYAEAGPGYSLLDALPLPAGQQTELTFPLPPGDAGVTRLIVWDAQPAADRLTALLTDAVDPQQRTAGLVDERWFSRTTPRIGGRYQDERWDYERPPGGILLSRTPYTWATVGADGVVTAKNCAVQFSGMTRVGTDSWGAFGQWQLGAGSDLGLQFVLPARRDFTRAVLRLQGAQTAPLLPGQAPTIQLDLNGWRAGESPVTAAPGGAEQVSFDLSQNLQYGLNTLALRSSGFGSGWLLQRIELWVE
jgi:hypothetical protein